MRIRLCSCCSLALFSPAGARIVDNGTAFRDGHRRSRSVRPPSQSTPTGTVPLKNFERSNEVSPAVEGLANVYRERLGLSGQTIWLTESRQTFESWLGRRVRPSIGGAYAYLLKTQAHAILINVSMIDLQQPRSLEIVVCEEFLHMRHWLDGDRRRHARHGYDRIAVQVAQLTGASMDEVRGCLKQVERGPYRYVYGCPACRRQVPRRRRGTWSCGLCAPSFSSQHVLVLQQTLRAGDSQDAAT